MATPEELRRQASQTRAAAADLAADANRLRARAAGLQGLLDPLLPLSQRVWVGPAAQDFESEAARCSGAVNDQAARLTGIAGDLDRRAATARSRAANLDNQAVAAEAAEAAAATSGVMVTAPGVI